MVVIQVDTQLTAHRHAQTQGFLEFTSGKQDPEKAPGDLGFGASFKPSDEDEFNALQVRLSVPLDSIRRRMRWAAGPRLGRADYRREDAAD